MEYNMIHVSKFWIELFDSNIVYSELNRVQSILSSNNINFIIDNSKDFDFIILDSLDKYEFDKIESLIFNSEDMKDDDSQIELFDYESENVEDSEFGYDIIDNDELLFSLDINDIFCFEE